MTISYRSLPWFICIALSGCFSTAQDGNQTGSPAPSAEAEQAGVAGDDEAAISALTALGATLKKNADGRVTEVSFRGTSAVDESLVHLTALEHVNSVLLNDTAVTDAGMAHLAKISTLRNIDIRECAISNAGVKQLAGLPDLRALRLSGKNGKATVDDGAMEDVARLTQLKVLALDYLNWVSVDGIRKLVALPELEELYLANTLVDDEALQVISGFGSLRRLRVSQNQVTSSGLTHLSGMSNLVELDLSENIGIDDDGLAHLANCQQLIKLNLWRVPITDDGVKHLAGLTNLQWLNLDNTHLTDSGLPSLNGMTKLKFLHLGSTMVTNAGLRHLTSLTSLEDLKVTRTGVDQAGAAELKKSLPNTAIQQKYIEGQ
jgi:Leucine-rich repeat (LRR) protein